MDRQHALENLVAAQGEMLDALVQVNESLRNRVDNLTNYADAATASSDALSNLVDTIRSHTESQLDDLRLRIVEIEKQLSPMNGAK